MTFIKDPDAELDYLVDWSDWLTDETIVASEWIVPDGIEKFDESFTDTAAVIWLRGGTAGTTYPVTNRITTTSDPDRIDDRTIRIRVQER